MRRIKKAFRITLGLVLLLTGAVLALPGVPGPGIAIIIVGLVILSDHFEWARRLLEWAKKKAEAARSKLPSKRNSAV